MTRTDAAAAAISAREADVLAALGEHLTNAEIAGRLFISIRTVESHVSSLLRKLGAGDRRDLAALAALRAPSSAAAARAEPAAWPALLTSFVGRSQERSDLATAVRSDRLVTAVGPGGIGKTRLALAAADSVREAFADGVWYVDLVPVAGASMVAAAVADSLGMGEQQDRSSVDTVLDWVADRELLIVLDNCEHVIDGVGALVERMLGRAAGLSVLTTSRVRLMLPFERVFAVPGLAVDDGDAGALFVARAGAAGAVLSADDRPAVRRICAALDGGPLAIELAAARLPAVGLDGLESGLSARLALLAGGARADDRHRSLRSTLDWSYGLLDERRRAVLRAAAVFAGPFRAEDAAVVAAGASVPAADVGAELAGLADHNLVIPRPGPDGTRYGMLETVRQYGAELLAETDELADAHERHARWCIAVGTDLLGRTEVDATWRAEFDLLADELRAALNRSRSADAARVADASEAYEVASVLAAACHRRGLPTEAQHRFEQAAELARTPAAAAAAWRLAAGSARARLAGDDAIRLHRAAAAAARRADQPSSAACDLAHAAEVVARSGGIIAEPPPAGAAHEWLDDARAAAGDDSTARAWIVTAEAFAGTDDDPETTRLVAQALDVARATGDVLLESAALDRRTTLQLARGQVQEALADATRRTEVLAAGRSGAEQGFELSDAYAMAADAAVGAGELRLARSAAERARALPFHREVGHVPASRLVVIAALTGEWSEAVTLGEFFRESWERAGAPRVPSLRRAAHAAAMVHGCRGDEDARTRFLAIAYDLAPLVPRPTDQRSVERVFEALRLLHLDRAADAVTCLDTSPDAFRGWFEVIWQPWYAALWAEAAVVAGLDDAADRIGPARGLAQSNVVAAALVDRAEAILRGDVAGVRAAATALDAAGCRYQWARSLVFADAGGRERGLAALAAMATPADPR